MKDIIKIYYIERPFCWKSQNWAKAHCLIYPRGEGEKLKAFINISSTSRVGALLFFMLAGFLTLPSWAESRDMCENWEWNEEKRGKGQAEHGKRLNFYILCTFAVYIIKSECECSCFLFNFFPFPFFIAAIIMVIWYSLKPN